MSLAEQFGGALAASTSPLSNPDAEIGLLTDLLANNRLIDPAADKCRAADFSIPLHGRVFLLMVEQTAAGKAVDAVTLSPHLKDEEDWPALYRRLAAADLNAGPVERTKSYIEQILLLSQRRRLVAGLQDVVAAARQLDVPHDVLVADADEAVAELADAEARVEQAPVADYAQKVIDSFGQPIVGVTSGIRSLDAAAGVLRPGSQNVMAGRPGMGKTATATSYSLGAAGRGHGVLYFSLEMTADELTRRILADMCFSRHGGIPYEHIRDGRVAPDRIAEVRAARARLDALPFEIAEPSGLTMAKLARRVRRQRRRFQALGRKLELVVVDYLQLMTSSRPGMSPYEKASEISIGLKELARTEKVAVLALAQLNREVEKRQDKRPMASDLRDSGQIEQDADLIVFLYREEKYLALLEPADECDPKYAEWRTDMDAVRNKIEFIVGKRRNGPEGRAIGWFFGEYQAVRGSDFYSAIEEEDPHG